MHGNVKTKHTGGDSARMPTSGANKGHPMQTPGNADKNETSSMKWNRSGSADVKKK